MEWANFFFIVRWWFYMKYWPSYYKEWIAFWIVTYLISNETHRKTEKTYLRINQNISKRMTPVIQQFANQSKLSKTVKTNRFFTIFRCENSCSFCLFAGLLSVSSVWKTLIILFPLQVDNAIWVYAIGIPYRASHLVSTGSIFLVGIDQFIAFKIDPFGTRNILSKPRRIFICFITWLIMLLVSTCNLVVSTDPRGVRFALSNLSIVLTGVCYFLVYKTISKAPPCTWGNLLRERRKENKQVVITYTLILGTTLVLFTATRFDIFLAIRHRG